MLHRLALCLRGRQVATSVWVLLNAAAKHGLDVNVPEQRQLPQETHKPVTAGRCSRPGRVPSAKFSADSNGDMNVGGRAGAGSQRGRGGLNSDDVGFGGCDEGEREICDGALQGKDNENGVDLRREKKGRLGGAGTGFERVAGDEEDDMCVENPGCAGSKASVTAEREAQGATGGGPAETAAGAVVGRGEEEGGGEIIVGRKS